MTLVGFTPDAENSDSAVTGLRIFYSGLPIVGTLVAMFVMRNYDLTEEKAHEISAELSKRKVDFNGQLAKKASQSCRPAKKILARNIQKVSLESTTTKSD